MTHTLHYAVTVRWRILVSEAQYYTHTLQNPDGSTMLWYQIAFHSKVNKNSTVILM